MYFTEQDPFTGKPIFVEKSLKRKEHQKHIVVGSQSSVAKRSFK
jgi:hypothetical protein